MRIANQRGLNFGEKLTDQNKQNQTDFSESPARLAIPPRRRSWELAAAAVFVAVHLLAPVVLGERYPFTISPMFCDQPAESCTYEVTGPDGQPIDAATFNLHLVYDGNPPGLGMGIVAKETLRPYCELCDEAEVTAHVQAVMKQEGIDGPVTIRRRHLFPQDHKIAESVSKWSVTANQSEDLLSQPPASQEPASKERRE